MMVIFLAFPCGRRDISKLFSQVRSSVDVTAVAFLLFPGSYKTNAVRQIL